MTIDEMKEEKRKTEIALRQLLLDFSNATGLRVHSVNVEEVEVTPISSETKKYVMNACELVVLL